MKRRPVYGISLFLLCLLCQPAVSTPVVSRASRMVREVYPDDQQQQQQQPVATTAAPEPSGGNQAKVCIVGDVVYGLGEPVPSEQPCLKCLCEGVGVHCETRTCSHVPPGCKAIHRPNRCCPDYQCECQLEGKTYANGERLPSANGSECRVCYCRGGEVQCAEVGCYTRDDCQPRHVPGQCCPRYDHCPPKEPQSDRIQYATLTPPSVPRGGNAEEYVTLTTLAPSSSTEKEGAFENEGSGAGSSESLGSASSNELAAALVTPVIFSIKEIESKNSVKLDKGTQTEIERPKITIQEVTPKRSEFQITAAAKEATSMKSPIKIIEDSSNELIDSQSYASEKTEVYDRPPPVLRIGDQLLFFKQGQLVPEKDASTPSPVITLIGAEGLQIGVGSEEIVEHELLPTVVNEGLQDISLDTDESVTGSSPTDSSSEEYIRVEAEESRQEIVEVSTPVYQTTVDSLKSVTIVKPIKRGGGDVNKTEMVANPSTEEAAIKISTSTEFIPGENPYYPPIPEDIIIIEDEHHEKSGAHSTTERSESAASEFSGEVREKTEGRLDELMLSDGPMSEESDRESKEESFEDKKLTETASKSKEETTEFSAKRIHLKDPEISSEEEQRDQPHNDEDVTRKILPDIIPLISNKTIKPSSETEKPIEWLKSDGEQRSENEVNPPLINEKAALPRDLLEMAHETDAITDEDVMKMDKKTIVEKNVTSEGVARTTEENLLVISLSESTTRKVEAVTSENTDVLVRGKKDKERRRTANEKEEVTTQDRIELTETPDKSETISPGHSITKVITELAKSKETVETSEEASRETTTSKGQHTNIMAGDDASIEVTRDSSQIDTSELVETVPGFELTTRKKEQTSSEETSSEENTAGTNPKSEVEVLGTTKEPQEVVEKLTTTIAGVKENEEISSTLPKIKKEKNVLTKEVPKNMKTDEKHKRDVVKKVLKDTFENPKENIQTELTEDAPARVLEEIEHEHEVGEKRGEEMSSKEEQTTEKFDSEVKIEDDFGDNPTKIQKTTPQKQGEVIQRIGGVKKLRESTENLDTSLIGIFRDFFSRSQPRYASAEEKV